MRHATGWIIAAGLVMACGPWVLDRGTLFLLIEILTLLAIAQSWNFLAGYAGVISLGHHLFIAAGGYALFTLTRDLPLSPYAAVPVAALVAMALAAVLFPILFRLREVYFAIGMWVAAEIGRILISKSAFFGASGGLPLVAARNMSRDWFLPIAYWYAVALAMGLTLFVHLYTTGRWGLHLRAMRDDDLAARSLGVKTARQKAMAFVISAGGCGAAGAIWFMSSYFIAPAAAFDMNWVVAVIFACVIGGLGTVQGPIMGVALYFVLRQTLAFSTNLYLMVLGGVAIALILFQPRGLAALTLPLLRSARPPQATNGNAGATNPKNRA